MAGRPRWRTDEQKRDAANERRKRYDATPKGAAKYSRYRLTEGYAAAQERHRLKNIAAGWPAQRAAKEKLRVERPEVIAAHGAVAALVRRGVIQAPFECSACGEGKRLQAHHHLGYAPEHWLEVQWLCAKCHKATHR